MISRAADVMASLGGGDLAILERAPQERARFVQMAGVLLTTAGIAVISMIFALRYGVKASLAAAIVLGLLWGVVIFNLDRFLVLSMGDTRDRMRLVLITLPRLALAVVLALVISTPLVLRIFASDIDQQLFIMQQRASRQEAALIAGSGQQQEASRARTQIATDQGILNGHLPQSITSPQLQSAQAQVSQLQRQAQTDFQAEVTTREAWQCELDGQNCVGSSGKSGNGPRAQAKYLEYQQAIRTYDSVRSRLGTALAAENAAQRGFSSDLSSRVQQIKAQARQELPALQARYQKLESDLLSTAANGERVNNANTGILAQLQALSEASAQNGSLQAARLAVLALFFLIEILPVTVKFLLNMGPLSAYEVVARLREDQAIDAATTRRVESSRLEEASSQARVRVQADLRRKEEDLARYMNRQIAAETTKILDAALQEWSKQARASLSRGGARPSGDGPAPSANGAGRPAGHLGEGFGQADDGAP
jgi:hypothetical protein